MPADSDIWGGKRPRFTSRRIDRLIAWLAERQHGVVGSFQLLDLGIERSAIKRRIAAGRLHRIHAGVFAVGHRKLTREGRFLAAVLAGGGDARLGFASAGALWGFARDSGDVHVIARNRRNRRGIVFHECDVLVGETATKNGIPATTPARTLLDCATSMNAAQMEHAVREALYLHRTTLAGLRRVVESHRGHRGARALRQAIQATQDAPGRSKSGFERRFRAWVRANGLPVPETNVLLRIGDEHFEVDCYWRDHGVVVELDHRSTHARRQDFERDRRRDRKLHVAGLRPLRVADEDLTDDLAAELRALLR